MCETHENTFISLANIKPFLYVPPILTISHLLVVFPRCGYRLEFARLVGRIFLKVINLDQYKMVLQKLLKHVRP